MEGSSPEKDDIRRKIWSLMEERDVSRFPRPVFGRIPNFAGAEEAALKLAEQPEYQGAEVVKVNPDAPQRPVRLRVLSDGKRLLVPSPRLRRGFLVIDPHEVPRNSFAKASTIRGSFRYGKLCPLRELPRVDLIVAGSVAVTKEGVRIGKGGGYSEIEYGILREISRVEEVTPIFATVHDLQIVDQAPKEPHDLRVDAVITPTKIVRVKRRSERPRGIFWKELTERQLRDIPVLRELRKITAPAENAHSEG
jgi:5-formyltetrahydrofolate cyclo-ligase